jgi:uncharacterized protein
MKMAEPNQRNSSLAAPFLEGLAQGILRYQRCGTCKAPQTLAHDACTRCGSEDLTWHDAAGTGKVYSVTVVTRAPSDSFRALTPYTLVLVELDEGPRFFGHGQKGLSIGDRVTAGTFEHDGTRLLSFRPSPPT